MATMYIKMRGIGENVQPHDIERDTSYSFCIYS